MRFRDQVDAWMAVFAAAIRLQLVYRVANWSGLFTNSFFLFFRAYGLRACFAGRSTVGDLDITGVVTYVTVSQALLMVIPQWGRVEVAESVRTGQIGVDLCRPVDFYATYLAKRLGISAYYVAFRFLPLMAVGLVAGLLAPPADWTLLPVFAVTVALGAWVANSLLFLVEVSAFWLGSERGVRYLVLGGGNLLSGLILPLSFMPDSVQALSRGLPFEYTLYLPVRVYLGDFGGWSLPSALGMQLFWAVALALSCRLALAAGVRKLVVQGG
ncbi:MAG: ABC-2 family transporter protein [Candidatus Eisenbacteria bacterium]